MRDVCLIEDDDDNEDHISSFRDKQIDFKEEEEMDKRRGRTYILIFIMTIKDRIIVTKSYCEQKVNVIWMNVVFFFLVCICFFLFLLHHQSCISVLLLFV